MNRNLKQTRGQIKSPLLLLLIAVVALVLAAPAQAQYAFGPLFQSTSTASITYNSSSNTFQYIDAADLTDDKAYLPLSGTAAAFFSTSNGWTASFSVNISARSMTQSGGNNPVVGMALVIGNGPLYGPNLFRQFVRIALSQKADTGAINPNYPTGFYGTAAQFTL